MRPSVALERNREVVRDLALRYGALNPRIFGSVLYGTDQDDSDLDLLVDVVPGTHLFDLGGLQDELQELLGMKVDLLTPGDIPAKFRARLLSEARPI